MTILIQTNFIDKVVTRYNLDVYSNTTNEQQCTRKRSCFLERYFHLVIVAGPIGNLFLIQLKLCCSVRKKNNEELFVKS